MRKKSAIWHQQNQAMIVKQYERGKRVPDILKMLHEKGIKASEFTLRSVLKENGIKAVWRMPVRKPELWNSDVVERIVALRNQGVSFAAISKRISNEYPDVKMPKSTVVRIVEKNQERITYQPYRPGDDIPEDIKQIIIKLYKEGNTIKSIISHPDMASYSLKSRTIRRLLKENNVPLTGKKGNLRRWSEELQQRVVDLHLQGMTFEEIKGDSEIRGNNPTDYAIRKILKANGVITRRISTYKDDVDENRFRGYRDDHLKPKDVAIIHKHLAYSQEGRELMIKRMKLNLDEADLSGKYPGKFVDAVMTNVSAWRNIFFWAVQYLYDDGIKKGIFQTGLNLGNTMRYLFRAIDTGDRIRQEKALKRLDDIREEMQQLYDELIGNPARQFILKDVNRELFK